MKKIYLMPGILLVLILINACNKDDDPEIEPANLDIHLLHFVDNQNLLPDKITYENAYGNNYSVVRLQYFVSDFILHQAGAEDVLIDTAFYIDLEITESFVLNLPGSIPTGNYTGISFVFGLDEEKNVSGNFPNPPENNMEWPLALGGGYHYMKLEGKIDSAGSISNYQAHTGPTDGNQNYAKISLPNAPFSIGNAENTIFIKMNINNWWNNPKILNLHNMTMVMGNQQVQEELKANAQDVFSFEPVFTVGK